MQTQAMQFTAQAPLRRSTICTRLIAPARLLTFEGNASCIFLKEQHCDTIRLTAALLQMAVLEK